MNKIKTLIQQHIKEYRASTGLTLRQFAEELGASHMSISYWERGDRIPNLDIVIALIDSCYSQHAQFAINLRWMVAEYEFRAIEEKISQSLLAPISLFVTRNSSTKKRETVRRKRISPDGPSVPGRSSAPDLSFRKNTAVGRRMIGQTSRTSLRRSAAFPVDKTG